MGIYSEMAAESEALRLQKVIIAAIESKNTGVISYCKEHILPMYMAAVAESFSSEITTSKQHDRILRFFVESGEFILTGINIKRINHPTNERFVLNGEDLNVTISFTSSGDTSIFTDSYIMNAIRNKLGDKLK